MDQRFVPAHAPTVAVEAVAVEAAGVAAVPVPVAPVATVVSVCKTPTAVVSGILVHVAAAVEDVRQVAVVLPVVRVMGAADLVPVRMPVWPEHPPSPVPQTAERQFLIPTAT